MNASLPESMTTLSAQLERNVLDSPLKIIKDGSVDASLISTATRATTTKIQITLTTSPSSFATWRRTRHPQKLLHLLHLLQPLPQLKWWVLKKRPLPAQQSSKVIDAQLPRRTTSTLLTELLSALLSNSATISTPWGSMTQCAHHQMRDAANGPLQELSLTDASSTSTAESAVSTSIKILNIRAQQSIVRVIKMNATVSLNLEQKFKY